MGKEGTYVSSSIRTIHFVFACRVSYRSLTREKYATGNAASEMWIDIFIPKEAAWVSLARVPESGRDMTCSFDPESASQCAS